MLKMSYLHTVWVLCSLVHQHTSYFKVNLKKTTVHMESITISLHIKPFREVLCCSERRVPLHPKEIENKVFFEKCRMDQKNVFFFLDVIKLETISNLTPES